MTVQVMCYCCAIEIAYFTVPEDALVLKIKAFCGEECYEGYLNDSEPS